MFLVNQHTNNYVLVGLVGLMSLFLMNQFFHKSPSQSQAPDEYLGVHER